MEKIVKGFIGLFGGLTSTVLGKEILVFIISCLITFILSYIPIIRKYCIWLIIYNVLLFLQLKGSDYYV